VYDFNECQNDESLLQEGNILNNIYIRQVTTRTNKYELKSNE